MTYNEFEDYEYESDIQSIYDLDCTESDMIALENDIDERIIEVIKDRTEYDDVTNTYYIDAKDDMLYQGCYDAVSEGILNDTRIEIPEYADLDVIIDGTFESMMIAATNWGSTGIPALIEDYCNNNGIEIRNGYISYYRY